MPPRAAPATFRRESLIRADVPAIRSLAGFMSSDSRALKDATMIFRNKN
jgi:hypothetical protein